MSKEAYQAAMAALPPHRYCDECGERYSGPRELCGACWTKRNRRAKPATWNDMQPTEAKEWLLKSLFGGA